MCDSADLFEIKHNSHVGRYAVAKSDIKLGSTIFAEFPFAFGPKEDTNLVCLGCYAPTDGTIRCTSCNWPVCGIECESQPAHKDAECKIFRNANVRFYPLTNLSSTCLQYECITPLRVLLAKQSNPLRWENEVKCMENHNEQRKTTPIWNFNQINIVNYLRGPCKLNQFSEEEIHTVCGILECNAFEANTISGHSIRCLYPKLAILSHNCLPNTAHIIDPERNNDGNVFQVSVIATREINSNEELYSTYTNLLWPTIIRRDHLQNSKYFSCNCERCADPLELNTNFSTIKCNKCKIGFVTATDPLDNESKWKCNSCSLSISGESVKRLFRLIQRVVEEIQKIENEETLNMLEDTLLKYSTLLHPKNAYYIQLKLALVQLYGRLPNYCLSDLPDILLDKKIRLCKDVLEIVNLLRPGFTRIRATVLFELYSAMVHLSEMLYAAKYISEGDLKERLLEARSIINEAKLILQLEPQCTYEGKLHLLISEQLNNNNKS